MLSIPGIWQSSPENWKARESAVLAIGAVSHGCAIALREQIPEIVHSLSALMQDSEPLVQSISCWAFGRLVPELKVRNSPLVLISFGQLNHPPMGKSSFRRDKMEPQH